MVRVSFVTPYSMEFFWLAGDTILFIQLRCTFSFLFSCRRRGGGREGLALCVHSPINACFLFWSRHTFAFWMELESRTDRATRSMEEN